MILYSTVFFTIFVCRGTDPEIKVRESASCRQGGLLKPPVGPEKSPDVGPGGKPPEAPGFKRFCMVKMKSTKIDCYNIFSREYRCHIIF